MKAPHDERGSAHKTKRQSTADEEEFRSPSCTRRDYDYDSTSTVPHEGLWAVLKPIQNRAPSSKAANHHQRLSHANTDRPVSAFIPSHGRNLKHARTRKKTQGASEMRIFYMRSHSDPIVNGNSENCGPEVNGSVVIELQTKTLLLHLEAGRGTATRQRENHHSAEDDLKDITTQSADSDTLRDLGAVTVRYAQNGCIFLLQSGKRSGGVTVDALDVILFASPISATSVSRVFTKTFGTYILSTTDRSKRKLRRRRCGRGAQRRCPRQDPRFDPPSTSSTPSPANASLPAASSEGLQMCHLVLSTVLLGSQQNPICWHRPQKKYHYEGGAGAFKRLRFGVRKEMAQFDRINGGNFFDVADEMNIQSQLLSHPSHPAIALEYSASSQQTDRSVPERHCVPTPRRHRPQCVYLWLPGSTWVRAVDQVHCPPSADSDTVALLEAEADSLLSVPLIFSLPQYDSEQTAVPQLDWWMMQTDEGKPHARIQIPARETSISSQLSYLYICGIARSPSYSASSTNPLIRASTPLCLDRPAVSTPQAWSSNHVVFAEISLYFFALPAFILKPQFWTVQGLKANAMGPLAPSPRGATKHSRGAMLGNDEDIPVDAKMFLANWAFTHLLEKDQATHGVKDYKLDNENFDEFQESVDNIIDAGAIDAATSVEAE
ncbi:hypothetical protein FB451DRAFT_1191636 [Mycena latifolia]|nr:hypothetical protein FB451DRAFT_1191636 [Mycena latifolia]